MALKKLYTINPKPNKEYRFQVSEIHNLYVAEFGNPEGIPVVFLHGGPGDGCKPKQAMHFNPEQYRIILVDQRGAGQSTPFASTEENTTFDILKDIDSIRQQLNIDKWVIMGSSWGSTLALLYAQLYSEHVAALIIKGIFLAREKDLNPYMKDANEATVVYKEQWTEFKNETEKLLKFTHCLPISNKMGEIDYQLTYYDLLTQTQNEKLKFSIASNYIRWINCVLGLEQVTPQIELSDIQRLILELSFYKNHFYLSNYDILNNINKTPPNLPIYIIHGTEDFICPIDQAEVLSVALTNAKFERIKAGHLSAPVTNSAVIKATDAIVNQLNLQKQSDKAKFSANSNNITNSIVRSNNFFNTHSISLPQVNSTNKSLSDEDIKSDANQGSSYRN